jgi:hypothetical protein
MTLNNWANGRDGFAVEQNRSNKEIFCNNLFLDSENVVVDFWYQNSAYPNEGRGNIGLYKEDNELLGLVFSYYNPKIIFNNQEIVLAKDIIVQDDLWHHFILSYDSFNYNLLLEIDEEEKFSKSFPWLLYIPEVLKIKQENFSYRLDDIKIIQGNN